MDATTVAVDLAKTVFEVAMANAQWHIVGAAATESGAVRALPRGDGADARRDGGVRDGALLGPRRAAARPPRDAVAAGVRAAVRAPE